MFSFSRSGNVAKRGVEFRHTKRNVLQLDGVTKLTILVLSGPYLVVTGTKRFLPIFS